MSLYTTSTDLELAFLLKKSDRKAFTEIYTRYCHKMIAVAFNYSKNTDTAEEVVQEVFLGLWERRKTIDIKNINSYLATAVKFSVFKQFYKEKRRQELAQENYIIDLTISEDEKIYAKFLEEYIDGIIETLPEKCRLVFQYSRKDQLTNREISKEMNISEKTVEAHMSKALKVIRKNLTQSGAHTALIISILEKLSN